MGKNSFIKPAITEETCLTEAQTKDLVQEWENMLAHQIGHLDSVHVYLKKLPNILKWIRQDEL